LWKVVSYRILRQRGARKKAGILDSGLADPKLVAEERNAPKTPRLVIPID
jgi:hypothetical protein